MMPWQLKAGGVISAREGHRAVEGVWRNTALQIWQVKMDPCAQFTRLNKSLQIVAVTLGWEGHTNSWGFELMSLTTVGENMTFLHVVSGFKGNMTKLLEQQVLQTNRKNWLLFLDYDEIKELDTL